MEDTVVNPDAPIRVYENTYRMEPADKQRCAPDRSSVVHHVAPDPSRLACCLMLCVGVAACARAFGLCAKAAFICPAKQVSPAAVV